MIRASSALLFALAAGCLPQGAVGSRDRIEADVYDVRIVMAVTTRGAVELEPFTWVVEGRLLSSHTRTFRDGSLGRLLRWEDVHARVERAGAPPVDVPAPLDGAWLELRGFPRGGVLKVEPLAPWAGQAGHLELLDAAWTGLTPDIPSLGVGESAPHAASWPVWVKGGPAPVMRLAATWTLDGRKGATGTWSYAGALTADAPRLDVTGDVRGTVELDRAAPRLLRHELHQERHVTTTWGPTETVTQDLRLDVTLAWTGTAPAPVPDVMLAEDDPIADAAPLALPDGRTLARDAAAPPEALPFLLLPDDLDAAARDQLRARLVPLGSMMPTETTP